MSTEARDSEQTGSHVGSSLPEPPERNLGLRSKTAIGEVMRRQVCRAEMPEPIRYRFKMLAGLIAASFHNHALFDMITEYSLVTFEMALRVRYRQLMGRPTKMKLDRLIAWADKKNLLDDVRGARTLQLLRNETLHAGQAQRFSTGALQLMARILEICNAIFEDPTRRATRLRQEQEIKSLFRGVETHGGVLHHSGVRIDIVHATVLHVCTLTNPCTYDLLFWPRFDPSPHHDVVNEGEPIVVRGARCEIVNGAIKFDTADGVASVSLEQSTPADHVRWLSETTTSPFPVHAVMKYRIAMCRNRIHHEQRLA